MQQRLLRQIKTTRSVQLDALRLGTNSTDVRDAYEARCHAALRVS